MNSQPIKILIFTLNLQIWQTLTKCPSFFMVLADSFYLVKPHHTQIHLGEGEVCETEHMYEGERLLLTHF